MVEMLYFVVLFLCLARGVKNDILCESGFCRSYSFDPGCSSPASQCGINNATHSGLWMLSPTICNCCEFCLPFIVENNFCSLGGPGTGVTIGRCGNGLTCLANTDGSNVCARMTTACHTAQDEYDARHLLGETGSLEERPACDGKGKYSAYSCVPTQSCFCQSTEGERIFGEALYTGAASAQNMHCGCSLLHDKIKKSIQPGVPYPITGPRCTSDGNFYPIQCIENICYCVNTVTGLVLDGTKRKVDLNVHPITTLECYDPALDLYPNQSVGSPPYNFTTPCLENIEYRIELFRESEELGFNVDFASDIPGCLPDGTFGRTSTTSNLTKICIDERGRRIGDYEATQGTTEYNEMDCQCAYTAHVIMASELEKPACCRNGNFRRVQCRRGACRCVDADGRQEGRESTDPSELACYTDDWRDC